MGNFAASFPVTGVAVLMVRQAASHGGLEHIPVNGGLQCCLEIALQEKYLLLMFPKIFNEICNIFLSCRQCCFIMAQSHTLQRT